MTKHPIPAVLIVIAGLLLQPGATAAEPREITWDDLVPAEAQFDDPYTKLEEDTLYELSLVASVRDRIEAGSKVEEQTLVNYKRRVEELESEGIDVDGLIGMRDQVAAERMAKLELTNDRLDGQRVRIPGYLLPLEYDGDRVTEFFLVPYVGACIHTPPPPPNQIVHVKTDEGYTSDGGLYTPVWVNGTIRTERGQSSLDYVDGASDIPSGYSLNANTVKLYE